MTTPPQPIDFKVERSDLVIQAAFASEFWPLFHNVPAFYSALLLKLRDVGLTPNGIRSDVGDGSLGGYSVNFWLLDIRVSVRIRLERVEIEFRRMLDPDIEPLNRVVVGVLEALVTAMPTLRIENYSADLQLHGEPSGVPPKEYLSRFVTNVPTGLGPVLGSGCVFYFGQQGAAPIRTITVDLSGVLPGKLYVRLVSFLDGATRSEDLKAAIEQHVTDGLAAIGLRRDQNA